MTATLHDPRADVTAWAEIDRWDLAARTWTRHLIDEATRTHGNWVHQWAARPSRTEETILTCAKEVARASVVAWADRLGELGAELAVRDLVDAFKDAR